MPAQRHVDPRPHELVALWRTSGGRRMVLAAAGLLAATLVGLVLLWPTGDRAGPASAGSPTTSATVEAARIVECPGPTRQACRQIVVRVQGTTAPITLGPLGAATPSPDPGTEIRVTAVPEFPGAPPLGPDDERWSFADVDRRGGLVWLVVLLGVVALVTLRVRGALAAIGVLLSLALVVWFLIPALLEGRSPALVALVCSLAVTWVTVLLTHGLAAPTLAAALGVAVTLALSAGLAELAVRLVALDGRSSELSTFLAQQPDDVSLRGVVLAGMLIGALGVLADTAVTQSSAVMALRRANPRLDVRGLYRGAIAVGRDHLAATIHTLVLAYVGTALPLLLVLDSANVTTTDALNSQDIAEPIAATIIGCVALIAAVPLTTGLASYLAVRTPADALAEGHAHAH